MRRLFCLLLAAAMIFCLCGCGAGADKTSADKVKKTAETQTPTHKVIEGLKEYYADDEAINAYLNRFNECNPDYMLTGDDFNKEKIHNKERDDQITTVKDGFVITLSGGNAEYRAEVSVKNDDSVTHTDEEFAEIFVRCTKPYIPKVKDDVIKGYWDTVKKNAASIIEFDRFSCRISIDGSGSVEYIDIYGTIE